MSHQSLLWFGLTMGLLSAACTAERGYGIRSAPLLTTDQERAGHYRNLARDQEQVLATCAEQDDCARLHYLRALLGLFENRKVASQYFQATIQHAPHTSMATSSLHWLEVLRGPLIGSHTHFPSPKTVGILVQDLIEREVLLQRLSKEGEMNSVEELKRQLKARDQKIEDLTKQLDALKRIDQEMNERTRQETIDKVRPGSQIEAPQPPSSP